MGRKMTTINTERGQRLKILLTESGMRQDELADKIGYTKEHVSYIVNGKRNLTEDAARAIIRLFPETRIEWLMGYDDCRTEKQKNLLPFIDAIRAGQNESLLMLEGLQSFIAVTKYSLTASDATACAFDENAVGSVEDAIKAVRHYCTISEGERSIPLSVDELNALENEIREYIELRLKYLFIQKEARNG